MTFTELEPQIKDFTRALVAVLTDKPVIKLEVLERDRAKIRVAVRCPGHERETVMEVLRDNKNFRECWLKQWPVNTPGSRSGKSIAFSADENYVLFDMVFFTIHLESVEALTPAA
jgi:hypothetical protein